MNKVHTESGKPMNVVVDDLDDESFEVYQHPISGRHQSVFEGESPLKNSEDKKADKKENGKIKTNYTACNRKHFKRKRSKSR